jgi:Do/DeqQ family serine protease
MTPIKAIRFLARSVVIGLAAAFLLVLFQPHLVGQENAAVELVTRSIDAPAGAGGPASYADAVARAGPAVVNINTAKVVTLQPHPFFDDPFFRQFFGDMIVRPDGPRKRMENSLGSGVIISPQGYILTNHHVIEGADEINAFLQDGRNGPVSVVGTDPESDLALLRIDLPDLPTITLGDSDRLRVGDVVLAIGNPFGVGQTVTLGIVSATGRNQLGINTFENFIQTDAAINPGNSGGALVDAHGNLVGINTAIFSRTGGSQGIGFAIPASMATEIMEQVLRFGRPVRGWLGFEGKELTPGLAQALGLQVERGLVITGVVRGSPAHQARLAPGDVLVAIDRHEIANAREALDMVAGRRPGEQVALTIVRGGERLELKATAVNRPEFAERLRTE